ncbi:hypothetical protein Rsub_02476 [Raphidocelis subcapitata]|uniref:C2 domain-containing protein n=1 Tax=Raphidocelis subcapitata TaxID=307507 RepID=A0A2V0NXQ8_9CHLO|nr:hypothetical protein Rsub_02476 [Raphidocelis subcapitata]|eukprot:GBF90370.1 hypothetical protein Rsub_02476 [Raphidocelis subcapitata]
MDRPPPGGAAAAGAAAPLPPPPPAPGPAGAVDECAPYGYDVFVHIGSGSQLIVCDTYGKSDPYVVVKITTPDGFELQYKTHTVWRSVNPDIDEWFTVTNAPRGTVLALSVFDKDTFSADDPMGSAEWVFGPWLPVEDAAAAARRQRQLETAAAAAAARVLGRQRQQEEQEQERRRRRPWWRETLGGGGGRGGGGPAPRRHRSWWGAWSPSWHGPSRATSIRGALPLDLPLVHPSRPGAPAGQLHLRVAHRASAAPGAVRTRGPVRFRENRSSLLGLLLGKWGGEKEYAHCTYKLFLHGVDAFLPERVEWNRGHAAAAAIFNSPLALSGVRAQHAALYAQGSGLGRALRALAARGRGRWGRWAVSRDGLLAGGGDLLALLDYGARGGEPRFYTYTLTETWRFSETDASFLGDVLSKHAVHGGGAAAVAYAGEFVVLPAKEYEAAAARASDCDGARAASGHGNGDCGGGGGGGDDRTLRGAPAAAAGGCGVRGPGDGEWLGGGGGGSDVGEVAPQEAFVLCIDNNSGTYRPPASRLPALRALLEANFPGLRVRTVDAVSQAQLLRELQALAPSRLKPGAAR